MLLISGSGRDLGLTGPDRAFAHRMFRETVVWRRRLDYSLSALSHRPLERLDGELLSCLRVGAVQLLILGVPEHAAVSWACRSMPPFQPPWPLSVTGRRGDSPMPCSDGWLRKEREREPPTR
jgi:hypothetical protein